MASASHNHSGSSATDRKTSTSSRKQKNSYSTLDRRTERTSRVTRETITVRTRSPLKHASETRVNGQRKHETAEAPLSSGEGTDSKTPKAEAIGSWNPQASIIPHTTAPLATRISVPPLAKSTPLTVRPKQLAQLTLEQQEKAVVEDLLYVFMGCEGLYIRYEDTFDPLSETDRLLGPSFRIDGGLDPSLRDLTLSMLRIPKYYIAVEAFVDVLSREEYGTVNHALCAAIRRLLQSYLGLVVQLENQFLTTDSLTLHVLNMQTKQAAHMMFQLYNLAIELLKANAVLEDENDDLDGESDDLENILEALKDGGQPGLSTKKTCKGGSTLGLITRRLASMSGDPQAKALLSSLLRESSKPYMVMLNEWLHHGGIRDPHAEFLIKEQKSIKRERLDQDYTDEYWEKRYTIREGLVPPQLEAVKEKVLLAGKYLNVVRECGGIDLSSGVEDAPRTVDDPRFLENVHSAYAFANSSLLELLLTTHALPTRLRSLKHYFFLDRADWFTYFLELGTSELKKPVRDVNTSKLQSLLDIVLRQPGSVAADDPYKDDVKVVMNETLLTDWLMKIVNVTGLDTDTAAGGIAAAYTPAAPATTEKDTSKISGFETLVLDYMVPFPLSLVVSRVTLTRYQLLFRYLLSLRYLETLLISSWAEQSRGPSWRHKSSNGRVERAKKRACALRSRMLSFVQQMIYYCTTEVIEPNWVNLMERLNQGQDSTLSSGKSDVPTSVEMNSRTIPPAAVSGVDDASTSCVKRTVDELMQDHIDFLATCLKECMLTNSKLLKLNSRILQTCTHFANYTAPFSRYLAQSDPDLSSDSAYSKGARTPATKTASASSYDPSKLDKLEDLLQKFEDNFTRHLKILLDTLNYLAATETVVFLSLCARLSGSAGNGEGADGLRG
ncbi:uncharacterized protein PV09_09614 [Verruconis gallopava]|uniref:Spindle pole body component n=1 Tax=Verruconis gallopava TaxID=253628 RepID=A0A0D1YD26_9PEZI|nr:uncharacterized protein PV09_09614 [Verruconis gallopava]KIV98596.1 hypothetical protein PV09_09614 [Verruconis gallopava]